MGTNSVPIVDMQSPEHSPILPFSHLDTVWIQLTGTVCNIACKHCFIGCGPKVTRHEIMSTTAVLNHLDEAEEAGARHIWFTGGEPTLHPDFAALCEATLKRFPLGILTNAMGIDDMLAGRLARAFRESEYSLEVRVSLDGADRQTNDRIRGRGVFDKTCNGIAALARADISPIVAVASVDDGEPQLRADFLRLLGDLGVSRPRVKWIPPFRIGREARRRGGRAYHETERITAADIASAADAPLRLQCGTSRTITTQGVFACPILIDEASYRLGNRMTDTFHGHVVDHGACHTCWVEGFSCSA